MRFERKIKNDERWKMEKITRQLLERPSSAHEAHYEILLGVKTRDIPMIRRDSDCRGSAAYFSSLFFAGSIILYCERFVGESHRYRLIFNMQSEYKPGRRR